jgi:hypothetical protein
MKLLLRALALLLTAPAFLAPADKPAPRAVPIAQPAYVDVATFAYSASGANHKVVVTTGPTMMRVDEPAEDYSFIYNPATDSYIGLENRNYTYWEFSWPQLRDAVQNSKRYEKRLQDLGSDGLMGDSVLPSTGATNSSASASASLDGSDGSGLVWKQGPGTRRVGGYDCTQWTGETLSGEDTVAWCYAGVIPKVTKIIAHLRIVNGPMALIALRQVVPDHIFTVYDALTRANLTPLAMSWGQGSEGGEFHLVKLETREPRPDVFAVPKLYIKTTLESMDGMTDDQPVPELRGSHVAPRVDHSAPASPNPAPMP